MALIASSGIARHDGYVEQPPRWSGDFDPAPMQDWHRGPFWCRRRGGTGGPLRRDPADRLLGGVASGVAAWRGFNPTAVRIVFVLIALATTGFGVAGYVAAWLLIPAAGADRSIASKARTDARGIALALGLGTLLTLFLLVGGVFNDGWFASWAWPQVVSVAGLVLIWRNGSADEQAATPALRRAAGRRGRRNVAEPAIGDPPGDRDRADPRRSGVAGHDAREPGPAGAARRGGGR